MVRNSTLFRLTVLNVVIDNDLGPECAKIIAYALSVNTTLKNTLIGARMAIFFLHLLFMIYLFWFIL